MDKLGIFKAISSMVVSFGVGTIIENIVKQTTPDNIGKIKKIGIYIGSLALSGMISDKVGKYVEENIQDIVNSVNKIKENISNNKELIISETKEDYIKDIIDIENPIEISEND